MCPLVRQLSSIHLIEEGFIKRIRCAIAHPDATAAAGQHVSNVHISLSLSLSVCSGVAYSTRVSPQTSNRIVDASRGLFNKLLPDVYIYSDHYKGSESGQSPGFALSLVAETTTGVFLGAEAAAAGGNLPEDVATLASHLLCEEISKGGCVDTTNQALVLLYMALSPEDVSKVRFGKLTPYTYVAAVSCLWLLTKRLTVLFALLQHPVPAPPARLLRHHVQDQAGPGHQDGLPLVSRHRLQEPGQESHVDVSSLLYCCLGITMRSGPS